MKKKMLSIMLLVGLLVSGTMTAYADNTDASGNDAPRGEWNVTFTQDGKMTGNLDVQAINDRMAAMEPGDELTVSVKLTNTNSNTTYWHMKNNVTKSMEKDQLASSVNDSAAKDGGYTYRLVYQDAAGEIVLYSNERVGGEEVDGLLEIQNDERLKEYFYLGTLGSGQSGTVKLTVGLDGETQGNSYQDKVANLLMQFAVELAPQNPGGGGGKTHHRTITREVVNNEVVYVDEDGVPLADPGMEIVKTSDEMKLYPYILAACISGSLLLAFAFFGLVGRKKEEEGGAVK